MDGEEKTSESSNRGSPTAHSEGGQQQRSAGAPAATSNTGNNMALSALDEVRKRENAALIAAADANPSMLSDLQIQLLQNQLHGSAGSHLLQTLPPHGSQAAHFPQGLSSLQERSTSIAAAHSVASPSLSLPDSGASNSNNNALIASLLEQQERERAAVAALLASPSNIAAGGAFLGLPQQRQSMMEGLAQNPQLFLSAASARRQHQQLVANQILAEQQQQQQQQLPGTVSGQQYLLSSNLDPAALALAQQQRQLLLGQQVPFVSTDTSSKFSKGRKQQFQKDQQQALLLRGGGGEISTAAKQGSSVTSSAPPVNIPSAAVASRPAQMEEGVQTHHLGKLPFPEKLYYMLEDTELNGQDHVVSFVANGTAVMIHDPQAFETDVMPLYFASSRMSSVQRQLNIYGFVRIQQGPWRGAYCHPNFQKNKKELLPKIQTKRKTSAAAKQREDETKAGDS